MKKSLKIFTFLVSFLMVITAFSGCNKGVSLLEENIIDDAYDNYYEIFVYSFNDTNSDGIGDLKGVTQKLDYVRDMGYTGIWLMPICPSPSYHKYSVTDYKNIDSSYGTLEDFDELIKTAHEKGIKVITDLVVNHTSRQHMWFREAALAHKNGDTDNEYYDYYNFSTSLQNGYAVYSKDLYYEARFESGMPDLNLDSEKVRAEISSIIKFWLDRGVDGFRLDACTSYYTLSKTKSIAFTDWIKKEALKVNPNAYIVGEVWSDAGTISDYYKSSSADSFFCFPAQSATGYIGSAISTAVNFGNAARAAKSYFESVQDVSSMAHGHIPAPFLCNHDTGRAGGFFGRNAAQIKFGYGLLSLYSGNTFTYYGDEIGMTGSANDPDKRVGMRWTAETTGIYPPGVTTTDEKNFYGFPSVQEQLEDKNSILNFYKLCNNARNAFPALMRGDAQLIEQSNENVLVFKKTYKDETIVIAVNFAKEESVIEGDFCKLQQGLCTDVGSVNVNGKKVTMPSFSFAIFA